MTSLPPQGASSDMRPARWENGKWGDRVDPGLDSVFGKLASYGLVAPVPPPNNLTVMADFQNRYVLLPKGLHFYKLIQPKSG